MRIILVAFVTLLASCEAPRETATDTRVPWMRSVTTSPIDDSKTVNWMRFGDKTPETTDISALNVRCQAGKTDVFLSTDFILATGSIAGVTPIRTRVDSERPIANEWYESTSNKAAFAPSPIPMLRMLTKGHSLLVEFGKFHAAVGISRFDLSGIDSVERDISIACNWPKQAGAIGRSRTPS